MKSETVLAIYGGTFSPPHYGHIRAAEAFSRKVKPDRFLIIPSYIPPHKEPVSGADSAARLAMCRLAFSHIPQAEVSDIELLREGKSYTVDTLRALERAGQTIKMLVGTDMFFTLPTWHEAGEVFARAEIFVVDRDGAPENTARILEVSEEYRARYGARIHVLDIGVTEISSTELREKIAGGRDVKAYLTRELEEYIKKWHLYQD